MSLIKRKCWYSNNCLYFLRPVVPLVHWAPQYSQKTQYGFQYLNFDIYIGMEKVIKRLESFNHFFFIILNIALATVWA